MGKYRITKLYWELRGIIVVAPDSNEAVKTAEKLDKEKCILLTKGQIADFRNEIKEEPIDRKYGF